MERWVAIGFVIGITLGPAAWGREPDEPSAAEAPNDAADVTAPEDPAARPGGELPVTTVIGTREAARELPGSGVYLDTQDIRRQSYDDINRVLRRVPGVYVREEDGFGLFPNISIRGTDSGRSSKITFMEDGVLMAPAPYSAPAVYNSLAVGRMSAVEVLKGSSQVRYGPHVTGGVVNYISTPIPDQRTGYLKTIYGSRHEARVHGYFGDRFETERHGAFSFLAEGFFRRSEGFKTIDTTPDFRDGSRTGFRNVEPMFKLAWEPPTDVYQRIEAKFGYTNRRADETYLGLATQDFRHDPFRRYSASRFDNITTEHYRSYLRHYIEPSDALDLTTTGYFNRFERNWFKLHDIRDIDGGPAQMNLSAALAGAADGRGLEVLRGERAGVLNVRANNREYESYGIESVARIRFDTGGLDHELSVGFRYHADEEFRFQHEDRFQQAANGTITGAAFGAPGSQDNRIQETDAVSLFVQDRIGFDRLTVTPGVRFEHLWHEFRDFRTGESGTGTMVLLGGGVGATYDVDERWQVFGGAHRGFSSPGPRAAIRDGLDEETSIATELGVRYASANQAFRAETAGFFTHFDDLVATGIAGAGGALGDPENVGRVRTWGTELSLEYDPGVDLGWGFSNPWHAAVTYTNARLASDSTSDNPESIFSGGRRGNRVPYIPDWTVSFGTGLETEDWGVFLSAFWVDRAFTTASNTRREIDPDGNPDARFGTTDSHIVVDLSAHYNLTPSARLLGGVHNLFNEKYIASRHPHGPRPGQQRFLFLGMEVEF